MKTYDLPQKLANTAMREADKMIRDGHVHGVFDEGDPNHPMYNGGINYITGLPVTIFGYETEEFLKKQYK